MSIHEDQTEPHIEGDHTDDCIKAVDDYRGQSISKWEAVTQISAAIRSATASTDNEQRASAGGTYLTMLDEHDQSLDNARSRGLQGLEQSINE
jgi:hypothetical protein